MSFDWSWNKRAELSIAQGSLTNSKRPRSLIKGVYPTHLKRGEGSYVWDSAGRRFCDYICGLGVNLLGYAHPEVTDAIVKQANLGASLSLGTELEVTVAEKVKEIIPFIDRVRFLKTGTDACNAAVRIARCKTGKSLILSEGYHGWGDEFISLTQEHPENGIPFNTGNDMIKLGEFNESWDHVAAVIVEPIITDATQERIDWLRALREKCRKSGTLLIFDEIITGFRFPKFSVSNYYGIEPDLICLGKAIANGMPLSVVGGKEHMMNCGEWFVSSTFAGETLSLAAGLKTMTLLQTKYPIDRLWERGNGFLSRFNQMWPGKLWIEGYATRGVFKGDELVKALFFQEACKAGFLFGPSWFFNFPHIELVDTTLSSLQDIITRLRTGSVQLEGELPQSPFSQRVRENK